jgi:uncharacterized protein VirK/YbjX
VLGIEHHLQLVLQLGEEPITFEALPAGSLTHPLTDLGQQLRLLLVHVPEVHEEGDVHVLLRDLDSVTLTDLVEV